MNRSNLLTCLCILFNFLSSVVIILLNKWVYVNVGFPNITLTLVHFAVTGFGLEICRMCGVFEAKSAPLREMLPIAFTFCGFVVFTNLSLQSNTIGTYQVAKVMTTPVVVMIQMFSYKKKFSLPVKLTLIPLAMGVICAFIYDIKLNLIGSFYASMGVLVTSFYQVWVSEKQHSLQMDAIQLLYYQAPLSAAILLVIVPIFEPVTDTFTKDWNPGDLGMVFGSGVVALFVNLTIYWLLSNTSPLTYNMIGQLKFCVILFGGYILFLEPLANNQAFGILLTIIGVSAYAHFKMQESKPPETKDYECAQNA